MLAPPPWILPFVVIRAVGMISIQITGPTLLSQLNSQNIYMNFSNTHNKYMLDSKLLASLM